VTPNGRERVETALESRWHHAAIVWVFVRFPGLGPNYKHVTDARDGLDRRLEPDRWPWLAGWTWTWCPCPPSQRAGFSHTEQGTPEVAEQAIWECSAAAIVESTACQQARICISFHDTSFDLGNDAMVTGREFDRRHLCDTQSDGFS
jgi:hypothetical protein